MEKEYREQERKRRIASFIRKEAKEYACICGWTGMKPKKIYFTSKVNTEVDLACEQCNKERTVTMDYPDEIINSDF